MDFTFTEEQRMMASALRSLTDDLCAPAQLRRVFEGQDAAAAGRWQRLAEMGLFGVLAPPASGGLGLGDADFVLLAQEAGRAALPEPLTEQAAVAVPLLRELAAQPHVTALLAQAVSGEGRIAVAHSENPGASLAPAVTHWLRCAEDSIELIGAAQVNSIAMPSIDAGRRLARIGTVTGRGECLATGAAARALTAQAFNRGALYTAAQCLGVTERLIELAVAYARQRVQFGRPIGSYQAIKHQLANAQVRLEFARPVVYAAAARLAGMDERAQLAVSHAKLAAGDAADLAARTAIQVHGAMGYSWEVDLHFYMKRAWALGGAWGDRSFDARRVQSLLCGGQLALGPDQTFEPAPQEVSR